jgi:hypothetical protein
MQDIKKFWILLIVLLLPSLGLTKGVYQEPKEFIREVFNNNPPEPEKLWISGDLKENIKFILGHDLGVLRLRYWIKDKRSVWILEEIGKERPITTGIVVNDNQIELIKILIFREIRGWEVRYPFFTDQYKGVTLDDDRKLDKSIDGITGATLSVNAVTKLAKLALLLHKKVMENN